MQLSIGEVVIGHVTPVRHHHHHLYPLIPLLHLHIKIVMTSTFNVLQLNANGIGYKLTELGIVMENNKVKVAVIHESKLTPKSKNPRIQNYTTVRKEARAEDYLSSSIDLELLPNRHRQKGRYMIPTWKNFP